jgi:hypothetical protein
VRDLFSESQNQEPGTRMFPQYVLNQGPRKESLDSIPKGKPIPTIPRCVVRNPAFTINFYADVLKSNCIYPRILNTGCASNDYQCFCRNLYDALDDENTNDSRLADFKEPHDSELADRESVKTCVENCYIVDRVGVLPIPKFCVEGVIDSSFQSPQCRSKNYVKIWMLRWLCRSG